MKSWRQLCGAAGRICWSCVCSFVIWTLWLLLVVLLGVQIHIAVQREFAVPAFVLRAMEERLAAAHVVATFKHATFDPTGRILFEHVALSTTTIHDPVLTSRAVFVELDPWTLLVGRFEPRLVRATGLEVLTPAMFSPSGAAEPLLRNADCTLRRDGLLLSIDQFTAQIANLRLTARGALQLRSAKSSSPRQNLADAIAHYFPTLSRRLAELSGHLGTLQQPDLHLELEPSDTRIAFVTATLHARGMMVLAPQEIHTGPLRAQSSFSFTGAPNGLHFEVSTAGVDLPALAASAKRVWLRGQAAPAERWSDLQPRGLEFAAAETTFRGYRIEAPFATLAIDGDEVGGSLNARVLEAPVVLAGGGDWRRRTGHVALETSVPAAWIANVGEKLGHDLTAWIALGPPAAVQLEAEFGPGPKLVQATGRLDARNLDFHGVPLARASAGLLFRDGDFTASDIILQLGDQEARGSYTGNLTSRDYRFLLRGRLRPRQISPWFHDWWDNFFANFAFPGPPPSADVDVQGRWGEADLSHVFVLADGADAAIRAVPFAHVHTRLFVRPDFYDGLELVLSRDTAGARGTFTRRVNAANGEWESVDFDFASTVPIHDAAKIFERLGEEIVEPFTFATPPNLTVRGRVTGPGSADGEHQTIAITAESPGEFSLYHFPLQGVKFTAALNDRNLTIDKFETHFAEGLATGTAQVTGLGGERRLRFDVQLHSARLGLAGHALEKFFGPTQSSKAGGPSSLPDNVRVDLAAAAEGMFTDPYSYHGSGHAELAGSQLGQVKLLGLLSDLLKFTALRFTAAHGKFDIKGPELAFSDVSLTGANSAIEGHGTYRLDRKTLDFNARVYPFQESKLFLQSLMGAVLTPLSTVLEVKLTGNLAKPAWAFVMGPTNFFRNLTHSDSPPPETARSPEKTSSPPQQ
ncbi:DUF3971 domain-containing protein [Horticoccus luteus]|uniref:DUF3971 domain-containing protein n=1 Tax=Horticoccus luteus TaxID=2862869 RepID=A0A8F9TXP4_9BACT|nr:DUF3971 domain-containing protein [Horticoccus luteus]QYM80045.1 DUF3971 domain-containing protein [Horticoccus luteus]